MTNSQRGRTLGVLEVEEYLLKVLRAVWCEILTPGIISAWCVWCWCFARCNWCVLIILLPGTTCVPVIVLQYITTSLLQYTAVYVAQRTTCIVCRGYVITKFVSLRWIVSVDTRCAASRRVLVERAVWNEILTPGIISAWWYVWCGQTSCLLRVLHQLHVLVCLSKSNGKQ